MAIRNVSVLILYNERKEVLLQHRAKDAKRLPDHWGFFGGGIETGETPKQALARELVEELDYKIREPNLIYTQEFTWEGDKNTKYVFIEKCNIDEPLVQHEGQEMRWCNFEDLRDLLIVDHDRKVLSKARTYLKKI